jgi:hypothetical protein
MPSVAPRFGDSGNYGLNANRNGQQQQQQQAPDESDSKGPTSSASSPHWGAEAPP